jgi:hypothetical protein
MNIITTIGTKYNLQENSQFLKEKNNTCRERSIEALFFGVFVISL